jgi:orotidine-5'-phosphate decarboxylase
MIIALDVATARDAAELVRKIGDAAVHYKVGLQLFTAEGPRVVQVLTAAGKKVFLDLKLHDIPNTVAGAVRALSGLGVGMLTVHASGGRRMLRAAVDAAANVPHPPVILAVTVLTSLEEAELKEAGVARSLSDQVLHLARMASESGCGGVVASALETAAVRREVGPQMAIVVPGIRPAGDAPGDQARTATPGDAIRAGASHLVIGRPVTGAAEPREAALRIWSEIGSAAALR